jgi:hypothetical protein
VDGWVQTPQPHKRSREREGEGEDWVARPDPLTTQEKAERGGEV